MLKQLKASALQDLTEFITDDNSRRAIQDECYEIASNCVPNSNRDRAQCLLDDLSLGCIEIEAQTNAFDTLGLAIYQELLKYLLSRWEEIYDNWLLTQDEE